MTSHAKQSLNTLLQSQWFWIAALILVWQLCTLVFIQTFGSLSLWPWLGQLVSPKNPGIRMPDQVNLIILVIWIAIGIATFLATKAAIRRRFLLATIASSSAIVVLGLLFREIYPTLLYVLLLPVKNAKYTFSLYAIHRTLAVALLATGLSGSMVALKGKQSTLKILFVVLMIVTLGLLYTHYKFGIEDCAHLC